MKKNTFLIFSVFALFGMDLAEAAPRISVFGIANSNSQSLKDMSLGADSKKLGFGGGVLFETPFTRGVGLETGVLSYARKHEYSSLTESIPALQIPIVARFGLLPYISMGLGGFATFGMGSVKYSDSSSLSFSEAHLKKTDFGGLVSLRASLPLGSSLSFFVDARYAMSLTNSSTVDGTSRKFTDMQALLGFTFGGMNKGGS